MDTSPLDRSVAFHYRGPSSFVANFLCDSIRLWLARASNFSEWLSFFPCGLLAPALLHTLLDGE